MTDIRMEIRCDLTATSLEDSVLRIGGVDLHACVLVTGVRNSFVARKLQAEYGFEVRIVPDIILKARDAWALYHPISGQTVWSEGA